MPTRDNIERWQKAIRQKHGCESTYVDSQLVEIILPGQRSWQGEVATFFVSNHPQAKKCYVWSQPEDKGDELKMVLELPPVNSAKTAVMATLRFSPTNGQKPTA